MPLMHSSRTGEMVWDQQGDSDCKRMRSKGNVKSTQKYTIQKSMVEHVTFGDARCTLAFDQ